MRSMRMVLFLLGALVTPLHAQTETRGGVQFIADRFKGYQIARTEPVELDGGGFFGPRVSIEFRRFTPESGLPSYELLLHYNGREWMFIEPGASLTLLVDGERLVFRSRLGSQSDRDVISGGMVLETAIYATTPEVLVQLDKAKRVELRLDGSKQFVTRKFMKDAFQALDRFLMATGHAPFEAPQR